MLRKVQENGLVLVIAALLLFGCSPNRSTLRTSSVNVLAPSFETVFWAEASLFTGSGPFNQLPSRSVAFLRLPFTDLSLALEKRPESALRSILTNGSVEAVSAGAKNFQPPVGLGSWQATTAYILTVSRVRTVDLKRLIQSPSSSSIESEPVWKWEFPYSDSRGIVAFYISQPSPQYLIVASTFEDLRSVSESLRAAMAGPAKTGSSLPIEGIPSSPAGGCRRFDVHRPAAAGAEKQSPLVGARALCAWLDVSSRAVIVQYAAEDREHELTIQPPHVLPPLHRLRDGIWQSRVEFTGQEASQEQMFVVEEQMFVLMALFGFAIAL